MVLREDKERVKALLAETITLLCKNGLNYKSKFCIEALIGITLDEDDVFLVSIKETVKSLEKELELSVAQAKEAELEDRLSASQDEQDNDTKPDLSHLGSPSGHMPSPRRSPHSASHKRMRSSHHHGVGTSSQSLPNLSLDDMQNDSTDLWQSITSDPSHSSQQESRDKGGGEADGLEPPSKRLQTDSDYQSRDPPHSSRHTPSISSNSDRDSKRSVDLSSDYVVIKDEPDSDLENETNDSCLFGGNMSQSDPSGEFSQSHSGLPPMSSVQGMGGSGQLVPVGSHHTGWQDMSGSSAAAAAAGSMAAMVMQQQHHQSEIQWRKHEGPALREALPGSEHRCNSCGLVMPTYDQLEEHVETVCRKTSYTCSFCQKIFTKKKYLKQHLIVHQEPRYHCPHCGHKMKFLSHYKLHISKCASLPSWTTCRPSGPESSLATSSPQSLPASSTAVMSFDQRHRNLTSVRPQPLSSSNTPREPRHRGAAPVHPRSLPLGNVTTDRQEMEPGYNVQ